MTWDRQDVQAYLLEQPRLGRLATTSSDGSPHVAPVWFDLDGDHIVVHTTPQSRKARNVQATGRFALTVDDDHWPYRGMILQGDAHIAPRAEFDVDAWIGRVAARYLGPTEGPAMATKMASLPDHAMLVLQPLGWTGMDFGPEERDSQADDNCASDCSLPQIDISDDHRRVQAAAFGLLLNEPRPRDPSDIATAAGIDLAATAALLDDFNTVGRIRFNDQGQVVGIAGLSIEPTRHRIDIDGKTRWTWCPLDAIGIITALGHDGRFTTQVPDTDNHLTVELTGEQPSDTHAVVFVSDGYGAASVVDTWCPTVNMFPDAATATNWSDTHQVSGGIVPVAELIPQAKQMWEPLVAAMDGTVAKD